MSYQVAIRDNATGEIRMSTQEVPWHGDEGSIFWWTEGNMSCDCNRAVEFVRALGPGPADDPYWNKLDFDCSDGKYSALYALLPDGRRIELDKTK